MGGLSGWSVQSSDSPMFVSSGYKCNIDAAVVYGKASRFVFGIKGSILGFYSVSMSYICKTQSVSRT